MVILVIDNHIGSGSSSRKRRVRDAARGLAFESDGIKEETI